MAINPVVTAIAHRLNVSLYCILPLLALFSGPAMVPMLVLMVLLQLVQQQATSCGFKKSWRNYWQSYWQQWKLLRHFSAKMIWGILLKKLCKPSLWPWLVCLLLIIWAVISSSYSIAPAYSMKEAGKLLALFMLTVILFATANTILSGKYYSYSLLLAAAIALLEGITGGLLWPMIRVDIMGRDSYYLHELNRGACIMALLLWPALQYLQHKCDNHHHKLLAIVLLMLVIAAVLTLESLAAVSGLLCAAVFFFCYMVAIKYWPRFADWLLRCCPIFLVAGLAIAWLLAANINVVTGGYNASWLPETAQHRVVIWDFVTDKAQQRPLLGWGMASSRHIPDGQEFFRPDKRYLPLHPHNSMLQLWLELGLVGVLLFLWGIYGLGKLVCRNVYGCCLLISYLVIGLSGFGIWQSWWLASGIVALAVSRDGVARVKS
jgi:O-antigen ligase